MKILAYCGQSFKDAAGQITGVEPLTCPPYSANDFDPRWLAGYDLLFFDFHGLPELDYWFEDDPITSLPGRLVALTADQLRQASLKNSVVIALTCFLADQNSPMLDALLEAGAAYVIGGDGKNWASTKRATGAGLLAKRFIERLEAGQDVAKALAGAKRAVRMQMIKDVARLRLKQVKAARDTLAFRAYYRKESII